MTWTHVIALVALLWGLWILGIVWLDSRARHRHSVNLQVRDWTEKVQAMRRLEAEDRDRGGDA
jgi:hypothetical protein